MSALKDKFETEVNHSAELDAYHVRVAGKLLTDDDKEKLWIQYVRESFAAVKGWRIHLEGDRIVPVFEPDQTDPEVFPSFSQAKKTLIELLQAQTNNLRDATKKARKSLKQDALAAEVTDG